MKKRIAILTCLCEGNSINATTRICTVAKLTVLRLLSDVGSLCLDYHDLMVRGLTCEHVQVDEIWSFVGCKERSLVKGKIGDGNCWTWVALDADTKLVVAYLVGLRDSGHAVEFVRDIADRIENRVQITSDGLKLYIDAIEGAWGGEIDYAMLVKLYGKDETIRETRYSPPKCIGTRTRVVPGNPDKKHVSTSYIERQNLTLRMQNRRFTRLTNAFSKKWENHAHAIALHYFYYNFCRTHKTLGTTPAIAAGVTDKAWTIHDLVSLLIKEENTLMDGGRINQQDRS